MAGVRDVAVRLRRRRAVPQALPEGVCRAPFTSMYLDQHGSVRACCQNSDYPLGNVTEQRLRDIWHSEQAGALRDAMIAQDLDRGCAFCKWQVAEGNDALVFARTFDHLEAESTEPAWPQQLELSMSNACNLQCIMCNGDWSSSIRANREGRPPLPQVYDEQFFEDLRPFLEHVKVVKILGGEPFLGKESLRVMEMLVEMGSTAEVHVTTNGTQWTPRVQRILEKLPMVIVVSLDGVTKDEYESIRIGSDLDVVLENIERFRTYAAQHGTAVNLAHCLMTSNWQKFPDFLRYAEERKLRAYVNTVTYPNSLSLFHLSRTRLQEIVDAYEAADAQLSKELKLNLPLWRDQLERLRHRLAGLIDGEGVDYYLGMHGFRLIEPDLPRRGASEAARALDEGEWGGVVADLDLKVTGVVPEGHQVAGLDLSTLVGRSLDAVQSDLEGLHGPAEIFVPATEPLDVRAFNLAFAGATGPRISAFLGPVRDQYGVIDGFEAHFVAKPLDEADPVPDSADLVAAFRARHDVVHEFAIDGAGALIDIVSGGDDLGEAIAALAGTSAADLPVALDALLGLVGDMEEIPTEGDGVMGYRIRFGGRDGTEPCWLEALVVSTPFDPEREVSSRVHLARTEVVEV